VSETSAEVIRRYLQDAITDSKNTETYLQRFADETGESGTKQLFQRLAVEAKAQHQRLSARLSSLGGSSSAIHGLLSQLLGLGSKASQIGHEKSDQTTQNLVAAFAAEQGKAALCEAIANISEAASDYDSAELARSIRDEATECCRTIWQLLPIAASEAYRRSEGEIQNSP
jgi:ferritin-like protein